VFIVGLHLTLSDLVSQKKKFDQLKSSGNLKSQEGLYLAYQVKKSYDQGEYDGNFTDCYEILKDMPDIIMTIIWSQKVRLMNVYYGDYLYAAAFERKDFEDRRWVFIWRDSGFDPDMTWKFETKDEGKTFFIKNVLYGEYLYVAGCDPYDYERRYVFTWSGSGGSYGDKFHWKIIFNGNKIALQNVGFSEYLTSSYATFDSRRRHVFSWIPGVQDDKTDFVVTRID
jgi:hypothetical protein